MTSELCPECGFPISEHMSQIPCIDDKEILGRNMEVVNCYASTCDGCAELTMHELMEMDNKTQLGFCETCVKNGTMKEALKHIGNIKDEYT